MMRSLKASHGLFRHWQEKDGRAHADADEPKLQTLLDPAAERPLPELHPPQKTPAAQT